MSWEASATFCCDASDHLGTVQRPPPLPGVNHRSLTGMHRNGREGPHNHVPALLIRVAPRERRSLLRNITETSNSKSTHGELCLLMAHSELVSHSCDVLTLRVLTSLLRLQMGFRFYLLIALAVSCHGLPTTTEDVVPEVPKLSSFCSSQSVRALLILCICPFAAACLPARAAGLSARDHLSLRSAISVVD